MLIEARGLIVGTAFNPSLFFKIITGITVLGFAIASEEIPTAYRGVGGAATAFTDKCRHDYLSGSGIT